MNNTKQAATELFARRKPGTKAQGLEASICPQSIDDALAIQAQMADMQTVLGWKCLLPPADDEVIVAPIFDVQVNTAEVILFEDEKQALVEPEICFVLSKDLLANGTAYSDEEIINAIGSAHMALELMQKRFAPDAQQSFFESLADGMTNQGMFVGPEIDKELAINTSEVTISITQTSNNLSLDGIHPNPRAIDGVLWLINYMSARGVDFKAGQAIITGSFKGIVKLAFEEETTISYAGFGEYSVTFKRA